MSYFTLTFVSNVIVTESKTFVIIYKLNKKKIFSAPNMKQPIFENVGPGAIVFVIESKVFSAVQTIGLNINTFHQTSKMLVYYLDIFDLDH